MPRSAASRLETALGLLGFLGLSACAVPAAAAGIWSSRGPVGGNVRTITPDPGRPSTLYAGTDEGVYKSADGGASWLASGLSGVRVQTIAVDAAHPGTVYAGTVTPNGVASLGIFKSTDGGASWSAINNGLTDPVTLVSPLDVRALSIDPGNSQVLLAGTRFSEIFKSGDGGATWTPQTLGGFDVRLEVSAFLRDPSDPSRVYAASTQGLLLSADGGDSWVGYGDAGVSLYSLALDPGASSTLYAGNVTGYGAFKSTDGGAHWIQINANLPVNTGSSGSFWPFLLALAADPAQPSTLYAATYGNGLYRSTDGGTSWQPAGTEIRSAYLSAITFPPGQPSTIYAGTLGAGIFASTDAGATWSRTSAGMNASLVTDLASDPAQGALYASTFDGVYRSPDAGLTWEEASSGLPVAPVAALARTPGATGVLFAGTSGSGLFASSDGGTTWSTPSGRPADNDITALAVDPSSASTLYAGTGHATDGSLSQRVYKSTDGGTTWSPTGLDAGSAPIGFLAVNPANPSQVAAGSPGASSYFQTLDGGATWSSVSVASACGSVASVLFDAGGSAAYAAVAAGVCKSTDGGATWTPYTIAASTSAQILIQDPADPGILYAGAAPSGSGGSGGVFRSGDGGQTWEPLGSGLSAPVTSLAKDAGGTLHAGTSGAGVADLSFAAPDRPALEPAAGGSRATRRVGPR